MEQSIDKSGISLEAPDLGSTGILKPLVFGSLAALAAVTSAGIAGWTLTPTLVLAAIAGIDGLFLAAYLQGKQS